jgi:hypothetical protein
MTNDLAHPGEDAQACAQPEARHFRGHYTTLLLSQVGFDFGNKVADSPTVRLQIWSR